MDVIKAIEDILEDIHQRSEGSCPYCGAEDFPVADDKQGYEQVSPEDAEEWNIEHEEKCPVLDLENALEKLNAMIRRCRVCGCTDDKACRTDSGPCHWVEPDLCSACGETKE